MKCVMSIKTLIEETDFRQSFIEQIAYWLKFDFRNGASPDFVIFEMRIQLKRIPNQRSFININATLGKKIFSGDLGHYCFFYHDRLYDLTYSRIYYIIFQLIS